jgi:hypothetical protein
LYLKSGDDMRSSDTRNIPLDHPEASQDAKETVKLVLVGPRSDLIKSLLRVIFHETAPHIGVLVDDRWLYHIMPSRRQGRTVSRHDLESGKFAGKIIAISDPLVGPGRTTLGQLRDDLDSKRYNRPLFFWMFLQGFFHNRLGLALPTKWLMRNDRVMCADLVSRYFYGADLSAELTPERLYNRVVLNFGPKPVGRRALDHAYDDVRKYTIRAVP